MPVGWLQLSNFYAKWLEEVLLLLSFSVEKCFFLTSQSVVIEYLSEGTEA